MGFTLKIIKPPEGSYRWTALFYNEPRIYSPVLELDELWDYPDDPQGRTDLMVRVFDSDLREIFTDSDLGPIEDGKSYTYDCSTGALYEAIPAVSLWPLAIIAGVGVLGIGAVLLALTASRRGASESGGSNPSLIGPIVAATVTMQKLEEEKRKKEKARGW